VGIPNLWALKDSEFLKGEIGISAFPFNCNSKILGKLNFWGNSPAKMLGIITALILLSAVSRNFGQRFR
jgi:hypothetical protein